MKHLKFLTTAGLLLLFSCEVSKNYSNLETKADFVTFNDELEFKINLYKDRDMYSEEKSNLIVGFELNKIKENYVIDSLNIKLFDSENKEFSLNHIDAFYLTKDTINKPSYDPWVINQVKDLNHKSKPTLTKLMTEGFNYDYSFNVNDINKHKKYFVQLFALLSSSTGKTIKIKKNIIFKRYTRFLPLKVGC